MERNAALQALIASAAKTADGQGTSAGASLVIPKHGKQAGALLAEVIPLRDDGFSDSDDIRGTAVFIFDPEKSRPISANALAQIFALTPAERSVAQAILNGSDLRNIAHERSKSIETVRSQLKRVLFKTGARSQLDLIRLAATASTPIAE